MREEITKAIKNVSEEFGVEIFSNVKQFISVLSDVSIEYNADKIRNLLRIAINDLQAYTRLKSGVAENNLFLVDNLKQEMVSKFMIDKDTAKMIIECIGEFVGYEFEHIEEAPVIETKSNENSNKETQQPDLLKTYHENYDKAREVFVVARDFYLVKNDKAKAIEYLSQAIKLDPHFTQAIRWRGDAYFILQDYDKAFIDFNEVLRLEPNTADTRFKRGYIYFQRDEVDDAFKDLNTAIRLGLDNPFVYFIRGNAYFSIEDYEGAIMDYTEAIELNINDCYTYFNRGLCYKRLDKIEEAVNDFTEACKLDPGFNDAKKELDSCKAIIKDISDKWKAQGLCGHCGGEMSGLFSKKCKVCGKVK